VTDTDTARRAPRAREGEEIWETTTEGLVWVPIVDTRGREKEVKVGGRVGSRLRIATEDRELAEERLTDPKSSAFRNGMLVRIDTRKGDHADPDFDQGQEIATSELVAAFAKNGNAFQGYVNKLNELNQRRMLEMGEAVDASVAQMSYLREVVDQYRPVTEGVQPSVLEMQRRGEA
jgi:hypothetical protein